MCESDQRQADALTPNFTVNWVLQRLALGGRLVEVDGEWTLCGRLVDKDLVTSLEKANFVLFDDTEAVLTVDGSKHLKMLFDAAIECAHSAAVLLETVHAQGHSVPFSCSGALTH